MNEKKKFLNKKRKNIFFIKKSAKRKKLFHTSDKHNNDKPKEIQPQSLINISKLIFEFIKKNNETTGNEIIDYINNCLQIDKEDQMIQKNIQRRVYDAINVMQSIGCIRKDKQNI